MSKFVFVVTGLLPKAGSGLLYNLRLKKVSSVHLALYSYIS